MISLKAFSYFSAASLMTSTVPSRASHLMRGANSLLFPNISKPSLPKKVSFRVASKGKTMQVKTCFDVDQDLNVN